MSENYNQKLAAVNSALNKCGIGEDLNDRLRKAHAEIAKVVAVFVERATNAAAYNLLNNVPTGIMTQKHATPEVAIQRALVSTCSNFLQYDIGATLALCAELLEDVNAHKESDEVLKMLNAFEKMYDGWTKEQAEA